jgi:DNA-binding MarR family transcriptional regulator
MFIIKQFNPILFKIKRYRVESMAEKRRAGQRAAGRSSSVDLNDAYTFFNEINIIAQLSTNQMDRQLPQGLNQSQFGVLNWFTRVDDEATPGRLAKAFQVSKGAMTNTLGKLAAKGFVSITADPASGRRKLVRLTPRGRKARNAAVEATFPQLEAFLEEFGIARIRRQLPQLQRIRAYLDAARD